MPNLVRKIDVGVSNSFLFNVFVSNCFMFYSILFCFFHSISISRLLPSPPPITSSPHLTSPHHLTPPRRTATGSIIREVKRIGGLDTVGIECGPGIWRRVCAETQLSIGVAQAHEITDHVKVNYGDADQPWWTGISSFENSKEQLDRVQEFLTFTRYCPNSMPVFVGHSLFFKAFYSKRISTIMARKRPNLTANLRRYRLSNATLLVVTVKYTDLDSGASEALILDADLLFGGGFHGAAHHEHAHGAEGGAGKGGALSHQLKHQQQQQQQDYRSSGTGSLPSAQGQHGSGGRAAPRVSSLPPSSSSTGTNTSTSASSSSTGSTLSKGFSVLTSKFSGFMK
jgi:hypothetical protein